MENWCDLLYEDDALWVKGLVEALHENKFGLREHFAFELSEYVDHIRSLLKSCQSPIETKFLEALVDGSPAYGMPVVYTPYYLFQETKGVYQNGLHICPQHEIELSKKYCADFLLITRDRNTGAPRKLIIECDGHDFHERTKEQAAKDRARDRDMTAAGFPIMRFTGSEIHKNAAACAQQACLFLARYR